LLELKLVEYLEMLSGTEAPPRGVSYHRQYTGFVRDGRRLIYGSFYPGNGEVTAGERSQAAIICDGGSSRWGIVYDIATERFSELAFNGVT